MTYFSFPYGTFANYSPRGQSAVSQKSRLTCGALKSGDRELIRAALPLLAKPEAALLRPFLNPETTLIPVPRSAPLQSGALWPAQVIAAGLVVGGYGKEIAPWLERKQAIRKSSFSPGNRPTLQEHFQSIALEDSLWNPKRITIVDDVLTMGRTSAACALLLQKRFPEAEIRIFAMIRTQGLIPDIAAIFDPSTGTISGDSDGQPHRQP